MHLISGENGPQTESKNIYKKNVLKILHTINESFMKVTIITLSFAYDLL